MEKTEWNPWNFPETFVSPDKKHVLRYLNLQEICMGGPLSGEIILDSNSLSLAGRSFGGPPVWSLSSRFLAIPEWDFKSENKQILTVIDLRTLRQAQHSYRFYVLHLQEITNEMIVGLDNPAYHPNKISVLMKDLGWIDNFLKK